MVRDRIWEQRPSTKAARIYRKDGRMATVASRDHLSRIMVMLYIDNGDKVKMSYEQFKGEWEKTEMKCEGRPPHRIVI